MIKVLKGFREVLNNSTYLAELKEQNGLLRQKITEMEKLRETDREMQKSDKEAKYRERQMAFLRPQYEMKVMYVRRGKCVTTW